MNRSTISIYIFTFLFLPALTYSQEPAPDLTVDAIIRPRTEFRNGSFTLRTENTDPAYFISQRSRLRLLFGIKDLKIGLGVQNIRVWGASGQITANEGNNTMIHEAWAEYEFVKNLSLKVGRQGMVYDDDRILGSLDWNQAGRWHDLALIKFEPDGHKLHIGMAYSQDAERAFGNYYSSPGSNYKTLNMAWYENMINDRYKFTILLLNTGLQVTADSTMEYLQTLGGNFYKTSGKLTFTGSFYFQGGENRTSQDITAFLGSFYGNYQVSELLAIHAGTDYLTGNDMDDTDDTRSSEFVPLYGTNHKFYGLMDYFYVNATHSQVGLFDKYLGISIKPAQKFSLKIVGHHFNAAGKIFSNEVMDSYLGTEIDLSFHWTFSDYVKLLGGYSQMLPTESMEAIKGRGDHSLLHNWAWAMLVVDARIFDLEWLSGKEN